MGRIRTNRSGPPYGAKRGLCRNPAQAPSFCPDTAVQGRIRPGTCNYTNILESIASEDHPSRRFG